MIRRPLAVLLIGIPWVICVLAGMGMLASYSSTPGAAATAGERWPADSRLPRTPGRPTLMLFAHPQCPCTRASIGELARVAAQCQGRAAVVVVFVRPQGVTDEWVKSDLWESAAAIPGAMVVQDDGTEARRFGAAVSGQTILYDGDGTLRFSGGITAFRGHFGDNAGLDAIVAIVNTNSSAIVRTPVFGCSLLDEDPPSA